MAEDRRPNDERRRSGHAILSLMRALALSVVLAAAPTAASPGVRWDDLVGDYQLTARTNGQCAFAPERRAEVRIDAVDGALHVDLAAIGGGVGVVSLAAHDDGAFTGAELGARVEIVRARRDRLTVTMTYDSGCVVTGIAVRSPIRGRCPAMTTWQRVAARCTRGLEAPPLRGTCRDRAERLELALIDVGCAPARDLADVTRGPACSRLVTLAASTSRCANASPEAHVIANLVETRPTTASDATSRAAVEAGCALHLQRLTAALHGTRCPGS